jgi:multiple sugar transport system substrate-binding protein
MYLMKRVKWLFLLFVGIMMAPIFSSYAEKVTINYYGIVNVNKFETKVIHDFELKNPNIKVNYVELPDSSDDKLKTINTVLQAGDSSIDVFAGDVVWTSIFAGAGWVEPWTGQISNGEVKKYIPGAIDAYTFNGKIYGLPFSTDAGMLFYRKDLLQKYKKQVPKTWMELVETSKYIMEQEKNPDLRGFSSIWKQFEGLTCSALEIIWSYGGDIVDSNGKPAVKTKQLEQALTLMQDMIYKYQITPDGVTTFGNNEMRATMFSKRVIFTRDWPGGYGQYNDPSKSQVVGQVGIAPLPAGPSGKSFSTLGGWGVMVSKFSKNKAAAFKFAKFRASEESQIQAALILKDRIPSYLPTYKDPRMSGDIAWMKDLVPGLRNARPRPKTAFYAQLSDTIQREISYVLARTKTPSEAANTIKEKVNDLLK